MKRRVMLVVLGGALAVIVGVGALATMPVGREEPDHPTIMHGEPGEIRSDTNAGSLGAVDGGGAIAGSKPGLGVGNGGGSNAEIAAGDVSEPGTDEDPVAARKPDLGAASKNTDPVEAGGLRGGVVLRDDPVQMGGAGGLCGPPDWLCTDPQSQVLAGGLRGGVVLGTDVEPAGGKGGIFGDEVANAGGLRGGVVLGTDPMPAGGRGGIFGDVAR